MQFYLGTHMPNWLGKTDVPLFVSRRTLYKRKTFPRALGPWALDSGGFTEVTMHGGWFQTPRQYAGEVRRFHDEIGNLTHASPQDYMCEPVALAATGRTVRDHQRLTVANYLALREEDATLPWFPVLQGWEMDDYLRHIEDYARAGVDLATQPLVGVGSVCRRQGTGEIAAIMDTLADLGFQLHGFGFKITGLRKVGHRLASADSMAWSYGARREPPLPGCVGHINCANCLTYALQWREKVMRIVEGYTERHHAVR